VRAPSLARSHGLTVLVIPAIDVRGGATVRLRQGDYAQETVYERAPEDAVRMYAEAGASRLHLVDLDAARGRPDPASTAAVGRALQRARELGCEVEVGGGVRTPRIALDLLEGGATHVVIGSVAVRDPQTALAICDATGGRTLVALDVEGGAVQVQGWTETGAADAASTLESWRDWPIAGVVYTNTEHDGTLDGPDFAGLARCRLIYGGRVYLSGGVRSIEDVQWAASNGAAGVIVGRALLDGRLDLAEAIESLSVPR